MTRCRGDFTSSSFMQRRDFIKIMTIAGATAALDGCGQPDVELIRFIPEEELTPGVATWKPSICTLCPAGCGTLVKVMEGDAEVVRNGRRGLIKMGLAKKIEGYPSHPISQGKLCPRGQAMLQVTYHPDRIKSPLKRTGPRGSGQFQEITWDEAVDELVGKLAELRATKQAGSLAFITRPMRDERGKLIDRFLKAFGAPPAVTFDLFDEAVLRRANALSFGVGLLPTLDLARSNYVISFGADFLGTWNSPVAQGVAYGTMRQGRPGRRGKFVMVEPRMSQTGANADEWIPARPGSEGMLALGLANVLINENLRAARDAGRAGALIPGWSEGLKAFTPDEVEKQSGVASATIVRLARELAAHAPALAVAGDAALAHTNGLSNALAVNALNALLGSVGKPGGLLVSVHSDDSAETSSGERRGCFAAIESLERSLALAQPSAPKVLLLYEANPVFGMPASVRVREAFLKVPFIASFGRFIDETSGLADLILPDHSDLESWLDHVPESGTAQTVFSVAPPVMRPLHNTRYLAEVLAEVVEQLNLGPQFSPDASEQIKAAFTDFLRRNAAHPNPEEAWETAQQQGGWWSDGTSVLPMARRGAQLNPAVPSAPRFDTAEPEFPFHFQPYASQVFDDGSLAHLPWLQEMPDPLSTAMWSTWVEINPDTALKLSVKQGDLVEVESQHGKLQAPALVTPGIAPDVVAMPIGQGHTNFTRYASRRGANPLSILAPMVVAETGSLAWAATRVKVTRVGEGKLTLFSAELREHPHEHR